jgi:phospholipid/cholesterol/gamma-HCH transport system substrate-binding protein
VQSAVRNYGDLAVEIRDTVRTNKPALQRSLNDTQFLLQELSSSLTPILTNIEDASRDLSALLRDVRRKPLVILEDRTEEDRTPWFK